MTTTPDPHDAARIERADGRIVVPAELLAAAFDLAPADVPDLMRTGRITSMAEDGQDEDAGRFRVTFWYANRSVRYTCAADGTIVSRVSTDTGRG
ncbi:hypothetical protein OCGS_1973 [Oceaniovalibus guishaninsula JLT2003]|uniref:Uncharacterized protein n=1 Tax=Oceaniovalibus guishaninsula JLT2003 TaxID=1231392 RepID=K2HBJ7_9RHOB|nr:DUF6522 family protein [Oceaniovalibus guishaninsula]EKE43992.1 hypothetical protein OCGS_1973 [Oceaniovalibus guishaninsula JLT2003]